MLKQFAAALAALTLMAQPVAAQQETSRWTALAERDWKDLPAAAQDAPVPQDAGYLAREVKPGVWVVTEGLYQAMFVVTMAFNHRDCVRW